MTKPTGRPKGRPKLNLVKACIRLTPDQAKITNAELRERLELAESVINAIGDPRFSSAAVLDALKNYNSGSINAVVNALPEWEQRAKSLY